jgi:hypothetical protein
VLQLDSRTQTSPPGGGPREAVAQRNERSKLRLKLAMALSETARPARRCAPVSRSSAGSMLLSTPFNDGGPWAKGGVLEGRANVRAGPFDAAVKVDA